MLLQIPRDQQTVTQFKHRRFHRVTGSYVIKETIDPGDIITIGIGSTNAATVAETYLNEY